MWNRRILLTAIALGCTINLVVLFMKLRGGSDEAPITRLSWPIQRDLGVLNAGDERTTTFELKNQSTQHLTKLYITGSCGCTRVGETPRELAPGSSATLEITFDSGNKTGDVEIPIWVDYMRDGSEVSEIVFLKASISKGLETLEQKSLASKGDR